MDGYYFEMPKPDKKLRRFRMNTELNKGKKRALWITGKGLLTGELCSRRNAREVDMFLRAKPHESCITRNV
jgi:hypothetical protein